MRRPYATVVPGVQTRMGLGNSPADGAMGCNALHRTVHAIAPVPGCIPAGEKLPGAVGNPGGAGPTDRPSDMRTPAIRARNGDTLTAA